MSNAGNQKRNIVRFKVTRSDGSVEEYTEYNTITNDGFELSSRLLGAGLGDDRLSHIAIGSDNTPKSPSDTTLGNELQRESASVSLATTTVTNDTTQLQATFNFSSNTTVEETGVFNSATEGVLYARTVKGPISLGEGDNLQITWRIVNSEDTT